MKSLQQTQDSVAALLRVCRKFRTHDEMSMATGVPVGAISAHLSGARPLGAVNAALIEKHTGGEVKRHELRPDLFPKPVNARSMDSVTRTQGLGLPYIAPRLDTGPKAARKRPAPGLIGKTVTGIIPDEIASPAPPTRAGGKGKTKARKPKVK